MMKHLLLLLSVLATFSAKADQEIMCNFTGAHEDVATISQVEGKRVLILKDVIYTRESMGEWIRDSHGRLYMEKWHNNRGDVVQTSLNDAAGAENSVISVVSLEGEEVTFANNCMVFDK